MQRHARGGDWVRVVVAIMAIVLAGVLVAGLLLAFTAPPANAGDRIDDMRESGELDCYRARVRAAGAYYREQGRATDGDSDPVAGPGTDRAGAPVRGRRAAGRLHDDRRLRGPGESVPDHARGGLRGQT